MEQAQKQRARRRLHFSSHERNFLDHQYKQTRHALKIYDVLYVKESQKRVLADPQTSQYAEATILADKVRLFSFYLDHAASYSPRDPTSVSHAVNATMADRDVTPDQQLLKQIFPTKNQTDISILQNWGKCIFKAEFPEISKAACVVQLEAENYASKAFTTIAAMQRIAATVIPDLVPETAGVGMVENAQGKRFHWSVAALVDGELLEDV